MLKSTAFLLTALKMDLCSLGPVISVYSLEENELRTSRYLAEQLAVSFAFLVHGKRTNCHPGARTDGVRWNRHCSLSHRRTPLYQVLYLLQSKTRQFLSSRLHFSEIDTSR
jgi:hypothetical protein